MLQTCRKGNWFEVVIPKDWNGLTIADLFQTIWGAPKKLTHLFRMDKKVLLNGAPANWNMALAAGDKVMVSVFGESNGEVPPAVIDVPVLYEDDHMIIFNKPAFMKTHPNDIKADKDTLLNAAVYYLQTNGESVNIHHVHRLDQDTTGAILFSKHAFSGAVLDRMLEQRKIKRTYIAVVEGLLSSKKGTINAPIGRDRHHATMRRVSPTGQEAVTHYEVIHADRKKKLTYVKCWLETGRTHQIRVHFSHIGHPLAGDKLYGEKGIFNRQALHAAKLELIHPFTGEAIVCYAPFTDVPPIFKGIEVFNI